MNRKIVAILCMSLILLSIQVSSADTLNITLETYETFADNRSVNITINLINSAGHPANAMRVNFTATLGTLHANHSYTNATGIAVVNISSWDIGTAKITAETPNVTNTANVMFVVGPVSEIVLTSVQEATVNATCLITATVYDKTREEFADNVSKWRAMPNVTLNFTATAPPNNERNSPVEYYGTSIAPMSSTTDVNGTISATIHLSSRAGGNVVDADVINGEMCEPEYRMIEGLAGEPAHLFVTADPQRVSADGAGTSKVTSTTTDEFLNPLCSAGSIRFNMTGSSTTMPLDGVGEALVTLKPSRFTGNITVNGTYIDEIGGTIANITNETVVEFYAEEPARIIVMADATRISGVGIPGVNESVITATVVDEWGHVLWNRTVSFSTTLGTLSTTTVTTNERGQATVALQSGTAGDATVSVSTLNDSGYEIVRTIVIQIMNAPFILVITTIEPNPVEPGGTINVTTTISGQGNITGTRYAAHAMLVLDRSGSMDPDYYAGTPLDVALVLDRSGSMKFLGTDPEQPMTDAKTAAKIFMDNLVSNAQVGVIAFEGSVTTEIGLTLLNSSDNKALVRDAINSIHTGGGTAIGDGLRYANGMLTGGRGDARRITILLTDGECTAGVDQDCSQAILNASTNHITIYTIGLGSAEYIDEPLLQRVASETGGKYYNAPSSSELRSVYNSIAQEISDYDITEIEYGTDGFTLYDYGAEGTLAPSSTSPPYILRFGGYDLDYTGDCRVEVNGAVLTSIPNPSSGDEQWKDDYEYDITALVQNGANVISFYDPNDYTNAIRNVLILANGITLANYPAEVNLVDDYPYNCTFHTSYYGFNDMFLINETINDLKVLLQWENSTTDLDIELTSPGGIVYGMGDNTTGYYFDEREAVSIDLRAPEFDTYIASASPSTVFADETSFYVTDSDTGGEQASTIMRWKLPSAPTHNARLESVTMYLRGTTPTSDPGTEDRSVNIYDLATGYDDDLTWNCNDSSAGQPWTSGSFSSGDNDSYLIDSVALTSSITNDVVEFNITSANWSSNRLPDWGKECNIVLIGSGYGGAGADRFASSETNPNDHTYTLNGYCPLVTITYSIPRDTSEYIWIHPLPYTYPDTDADTVENGDWVLRVTGSGTGSERFNITTHVDKKSAAKLASHAFISSLDPTREDRVGLATYSYSSTNETANQTSYICEGDQWEGYFTVSTQGIYYFNLTWNDASDLDICLYDGVNVLDTSATGSNPEVVSATLSPGTNYRAVVNGTNVSGSDTKFTINSSSSSLMGVMCAYRDSNSASVPRYRQWDGDAWLGESSAKDVDGDIDWIVLQSCPTRNEVIMGALDDERDLNMQMWDGSGWGAVQEFSWIANYDHHRGFDIAYEQNSGDAMVVYRNSDISTAVPRYRVWDGSIWGAEGAVDGTGASKYIQWARLAAKPNSDEILLVFLNSDNNIRAQVWGGTSWGDVVLLTNDASAGSDWDYQCFDVVYEQGTGNALVAWAQSDRTVRYSRWDGVSWSVPATIYTGTHQTRWIKLASDPNSNNILVGALDTAYDISVSIWDGLAWTTTNREIETASHGYNRRYFDVSFEQASGIGMVVWSDNTHTPKYQTWNVTGDSWSPESSASSIGTNYVSWVQLTPDPESDEIFLMTSEGSDSGIDIQKWDGSVWGAVSEVETSSTRQYECFDLTHSQQDTSRMQTTVRWHEWRAQTDNPLTDSIGGFDPINSSIDSLTADGMTAIDEGLYEANDALTGYENGTIVLMTDGIDNVGYHSMIAEAELAAARNTTIFTVGFGSTIDNRTLERIANITGGKYYPAQNATDLENIFVGIAGELGNYTAPEPQINVYIGSNTTIEGSFVNITYVSDSANVTYYNRTDDEYWHEDPLNPDITSIENRTILSWDVGNRPVPYMITVGKYWRVAYQLTVDNESANSIPVIIAPSSITYDDSNGTRVNETIPETAVTVRGNATPDVHTKSATNLVLSRKSESDGPPTRHPPSKPETIVEYAYKLTAELTDINESKVVAGTLVEFKASAGTLYNHTYPGYGDDTQLRSFNETTAAANNGGAVVWLCSDAPGTITVWAYHTPENGTRLNTSTIVTFHSLESPPIIPPAPHPRGEIRLE